MTRLDRFNRMMAAMAAAAIIPMTAGAATAGKKNLVDTAVGAEKFNVFLRAARKAGLDAALKVEGPYTVFAPTDEAFAKLPENELKAMLADEERLTALLTYHVVPGKVGSSGISDLQSATTLQGNHVRIDTRDGVKVEEARVIEADIKATNGVIHAIDTVLLPK